MTTRTRLTAAAIREIVGPIDDATAARIEATGATPGELLEAWQWMTSDDVLGGIEGRRRSTAVNQLMGILQETVEPPDEDARL